MEALPQPQVEVEIGEGEQAEAGKEEAFQVPGNGWKRPQLGKVREHGLLSPFQAAGRGGCPLTRGDETWTRP